MKLTCSNTNPPFGGLLVANYVKIIRKIPLEISWGDETVINKTTCKTSNDLARAIAKSFLPEIYGTSDIEMTEVDHWLTFALGNLNSKADFSNALNVLNKMLGPVTYLVSKRLTIADFVMFAALYSNKYWQDLLSEAAAPVNILRWYNFINAQDAVQFTVSSLTPELKAALHPARKDNRHSVEKSSTGARAREGKFIDLPDAEMGKVIVRFPPEASGYLHIGHAKAALLNQYYQQTFQGKLIMRFDDTNPAKENPHFEKVILEDVAMLELKPDMFTHTSELFDVMLDYCEKMLKDGTAYVDDTEAELMKQQREQRIESENRSNSVEKNLQLWEEMKKGTERGQKCCVRAKIDMQSANGCLRDPTIYRCKNEPHPRTGDKYKVYPTYDFACPIVDSVEGVTHTLRTMEYHDRDPQYYWFIEALGLRKPYIWEYSRLSMTNTVLSKRKLTWFVQEGLVDGWDDPRMPTVRGVLRRGMTVQGLKEFIIAQGSSRSVVFMEWDKIWAFNKKVIDPIAPRYTALEFDNPVPVLVKNAKEECLTVPLHPKNAEVGTKEVWVGPRLLIDRIDAATLKEGENATFINWGNLMIKKINRKDGVITSVDAETNLDNKDYKKTVKLTWLADTPNAKFTPTYCVYFDHLMSKALLGKDEDFKQFINKDTRKEVHMLGDPELKKLKKGDIIQLQRRGFFRVDVAYEPVSLFSCREQSVILFHVPDGHTKESPMSGNVVEKKVASSSVGTGKKSAGDSKGTKIQTEPIQSESAQTQSVSKSPSDINNEIVKQGEIVRNLKSEKAQKSDIDAAVKVLLSLKADYKSQTGTEWKPPQANIQSNLKIASVEKSNSTIAGQGEKAKVQTKSPQTHSVSKSPSDISNEIVKQGDIVRNLKSQKAPKSNIDAAVKVLLSLKTDYKTQTGTEWKPSQENIQSNLKSASAEKSSSTIAAQGDKAKIQTKSPQTQSVSKSPSDINSEIVKQGDIVRNLKSQKAPKSDIDAAVKVLLSLKTDYKTQTGTEWKPSPENIQSNLKSATAEKSSSTIAAQGDKAKTQTKSPQTQTVSKSPSDINNEIVKQGDIVRNLKSQKAPKSDIDGAVKVLLSLKTDYKTQTGTEWKPSQENIQSNLKSASAEKSSSTIAAQGDKAKAQTKSPQTQTVSKSPSDINNEIVKQGDIVRNLKSQKAQKSDVDAAVKVLLSLKADYKTQTGTEWKPSQANIQSNLKSASAEKSSSTIAAQGDKAKVQTESPQTLSVAKSPSDINNEIVKQGNIVRNLKSQKAQKSDIDAAVKVLLSLKANYKAQTGIEWKPSQENIQINLKSASAEKSSSTIAAQGDKVADGGPKKQTRLGLEAKKEESLSDWYSQVITKGEMIEYYDVSGCYILRPWSFAIWNVIRDWFGEKLEDLEVEDCYFPIFVSKSVLEKEKTHIADFAPEVAWVTKSGDSDMAEPIAVRPTSETVMYPAYAKWIQSYRDLPIKLNQWNNVVRWEFKHPQPFLRTREFLWQEGHTAYASKEEACTEVGVILDLYARIYEDLLAVPVVKGKKTEKEKFAGGDYTLTVEAFVSASGRAIQGGTSHHLGQNFSKMFEVVYEDPETQEKKYVYQNSWGITTRTIGVMIMVHSDNKGLVLPPRVARIQIVIVPCGITVNLSQEKRKILQDSCGALQCDLKKAGIKAKGDYRQNYSPGWKFNHWELKGVPIRVELGPKDIEKQQIVAVRRETGEKIVLPRDSAVEKLNQLLEDIQTNLFKTASNDLESHKILLTDWSQFTPNLDKKNMILAPFCGDSGCEDRIKADSTRDDAEAAEPGAPSMGAKSLCIPFEQPAQINPTDKCIHPACSRKPLFYTLFGRSY